MATAGSKVRPPKPEALPDAEQRRVLQAVPSFTWLRQCRDWNGCSYARAATNDARDWRYGDLALALGEA